MNKANATKIISDILATLAMPNEELNDDFAVESFSDTRNIKSEKDIDKMKGNLSVVLIGRAKIERYNSLYRDLYNEMNVKNKCMSFKYFKTTTQQLIFEDKFNFDSISNLLANATTTTIYNVAPIWGMSLQSDFVIFGKYTFINKSHMCEYIKSHTDIKDDDFLSNSSIKMIENWSQRKASCIYLLIGYDVYDSVFADELFEKERISVINVLRYMLGVQWDRIYIGKTEFVTYEENKIQFTNDILLAGSKTNRKDIEVDLDPDYYSEDNGNKRVWEILSKSNPNEFEKRIVNAIQWIGRSLNEEVGNDISISEIAFAFETLLKRNISVSPITASIQGSISEMVAYIVGENLEERLNLIKRFKDFYGKRSSVVHGGVTENDIKLYYEFLNNFKFLVIELLTNNKFCNCKSIEELYSIIDVYKFRADENEDD